MSTPQPPGAAAPTSHEHVLETLKTQLARLLRLETTAHLSEDTRLVQDLGIDSLGMVDLVVMVEETFDVKIKSSTDLSQVRTIGDMARLLTDHFHGDPARN